MSASWRASARSQWLKSKLPPVRVAAMPGTAKVEVRVGWTSLVGVEFRFDPPSPQWPASRVSKNPKIEKSPCVIVAIATDDHNAATIATVVTNRLRHRAPPNPKFPFCISTPKPVGTLLVSLNPSAKSDERWALLPRPLVRKLRTRSSYHSIAYLVKKVACPRHILETLR